MSDKFIDSYFKNKSGGSTKVTSSSTPKPNSSSDSYISSYFNKKKVSATATDKNAVVKSKIKSVKKSLDTNGVKYLDTNWTPTDQDKTKANIKYGTVLPNKNKTSKNTNILTKVKNDAMRAINVIASPLYGVQGALKAAATDRKPGETLGKKAINVLGALGNGLKSGVVNKPEDMVTGSDVIKTLLKSKNNTKLKVGAALTSDTNEGFNEAKNAQTYTAKSKGVTYKDIVARKPEAMAKAESNADKMGLLGDLVVDPLNYITGGLGAVREVARGSGALRKTQMVDRLVAEKGVKVLSKAGLQTGEDAVKELRAVSVQALKGSTYKGVKVIGKTVIKPEVAAKTGDVIRKAFSLIGDGVEVGARKALPQTTFRDIARGVDNIKAGAKEDVAQLGKLFVGGKNSDLVALAKAEPENVLEHMAVTQARNKLNINKTMRTVEDVQVHNAMAKGMTEDEAKATIHATEAPVYHESVVSKKLEQELTPEYVRSVTKFENEMQRKYNDTTSRIYKLKEQMKTTNNAEKLKNIQAQIDAENKTIKTMDSIKTMKGKNSKTYQELADHYVGNKTITMNDFIKGDFKAMISDAGKTASDKVKKTKTIADLPRGQMLHQDKSGLHFVNIKDYAVDKNGIVHAITDDMKSLKLSDLRAPGSEESAMTSMSRINTTSKGIKESNADLFKAAKEEAAPKQPVAEKIKTALDDATKKAEEEAKTASAKAKIAEYQKMLDEAEKENKVVNVGAQHVETPINKTTKTETPISKLVPKTDSEKAIEVLERKANDKRISAREKAGYQRQIEDIKKADLEAQIIEANKYKDYKKNGMDKAINRLQKGLGEKQSDIETLAKMSTKEKTQLSHDLLDRHRALLLEGKDAEKAVAKAQSAKASKAIDNTHIEMNDVKQSDSRGGKVSMNPKDDLELAAPEKGEQLEKQYKYLEDIGYDMSHFDSGVRDAIKNRTLTNAEYKEAIKPLKEVQASDEVKALKAAKSKATRETVLTDGKFKKFVMDKITALPNKTKLTPEVKDFVKRITGAKTKGDLFDVMQDIDIYNKERKLGIEAFKDYDYAKYLNDGKVAEKGSESVTNASKLVNSSDDADLQSLMNEYHDEIAQSESQIIDQVDKIVKETNTKPMIKKGKLIWEGDEKVDALVFDYNGTRITIDKKASSNLVAQVVKALKELPNEFKPLAKDIKILNGKMYMDDAMLQGLEKSKTVSFFSNKVNNQSKAAKALGDKAGNISNTAHVLRHELAHVADNVTLREKITKESQDILKGLDDVQKNELADLLLANKNSVFGSNKEAIIQRLNEGHISRYSASTTGQTMHREHTAELIAAMSDDSQLASKLGELMPGVKENIRKMLVKAKPAEIKDMIPKGIKNRTIVVNRLKGLQTTYKATEEALMKETKVLDELSNQEKYLRQITTGNDDIRSANDPIVQAFAKEHPELENSKFQEVWKETYTLMDRYPENDLPAHLHEFTDIFKAKMKQIGDEEGISNMIDRYVPHIMNPVYAKDKKAVDLFRMYGFDEPFNKFAQTRSDMRTIKEINDYMLEKHGLPNYLQDTMEKLYLQRSLYHNQFMWEKDMTDLHLNMWGKQIHNENTIKNMTADELEILTEEYKLPIIGATDEETGHVFTHKDVARDYFDKVVKPRIESGQFKVIRKGDEFTPMDDVVTIPKTEAQASFDRTNQFKTEAWRTKRANEENTTVGELADRVVKNPFVEVDPKLYSSAEVFEKNKDNIYLMPISVYNNYQKVMTEQFRQSKNFLTRIIDAPTKVFKYSATVVNPTFHMSNIFGNLLNSYLGIGAHIFNPELHMDAIHAVAGSSKMINGKTAKEWNKILIENGVFGGEFFSKDIQQTVKSSRDLFHDIREPRPIVKGVKKALNAPQNLAAKIEEQNKALNFFAHLKDGKSIQEAARLTNKYTFDYGDLTMFENNVMKRAVPFYTWMRKNIPLQLENMIEQPVKYSNMQKVARTVSKPETVEENEYKPEYLQNAIKIGDDKYLNMNLPMNDVFKFLSPKDMFSSINPIAKMLVELGTNRNVYFDSDIKNDNYEMVKAPTLLSKIPGLTKKTPNGDFIDPRVLYAIKSMMPNIASYSNVGDAITGSGKGADRLKGAGYAAGLRLYQPDLAQAQTSEKYDILDDLNSKKKAAIKQGYIPDTKNKNTVSKAAEEAILRRYLYGK